MLYLFNSQAVFDSVFGKNPHMFAAQPNSLNSKKNNEASTKYLDLCKLGIFLGVCFDDYIISASVDTYILVQYLCIHTVQLNQDFINNSKYTTDRPNDFLISLDLQQAFQTMNQPVPSPYVTFYFQHCFRIFK